MPINPLWLVGIDPWFGEPPPLSPHLTHERAFASLLLNLAKLRADFMCDCNWADVELVKAVSLAREHEFNTEAFAVRLFDVWVWLDKADSLGDNEWRKGAKEINRVHINIGH